MLDLVKTALLVRTGKQVHRAEEVETTKLNDITRLYKLSQTLPKEMTSSAATQPYCSPNSASSALFSLLALRYIGF